MEACLEIKNLVKKYSKRVVVNRVSLTVKQGEIVGILGPNGAGKTTTFRMVVGLIPSDEGEIYFNGQEISKMPMYSRAQMGIGYLPQEPTVFARLTVRENLMIIMEHLSISRKTQKQRMKTLLDEMQLEHLGKAKAGTLSGGERRRLEVARALVTSPSFLMLDEPFAAIDPKIVEGLQEIILQLREKNIGILITDHKPRETLSITDRTYIIHKGKILKHGITADLVSDANVRKTYLGEKFFMPEVHNVSVEQQKQKREIVQQKMRQKAYPEAINILTDLIGANTENPENYYQRAFCFYQLKDFPSARHDCQKACRLRPGYSEAEKLSETLTKVFGQL